MLGDCTNLSTIKIQTCNTQKEVEFFAIVLSNMAAVKWILVVVNCVIFVNCVSRCTSVVSSVNHNKKAMRQKKKKTTWPR